jgi:Ni,Fe-hydrogenase III large subunit
VIDGHFGSTCSETILQMRARLYFTHKGTERLFAGRLPADAVALAERVSGDTCVGHALAFCEAVEKLSGTEVPMVVSMTRSRLLELERLYNHIGDVGAILADTGFAVGQALALRVREACCASKAADGPPVSQGVVPGGVQLRRRVTGGRRAALVADFEEMVDISLSGARHRRSEGGCLPLGVPGLGVVGYVAAPAGGGRVRRAYPSAAYARLSTEPVTERAGDVRARMLVRVREVAASVQIIERTEPGAGAPAELRADLGPRPPFTRGFGLVEGWRGRIAHAVMAGDDGRLCRVKIVDPSFFNWPALARALQDNIVPDFPLCNKSFNQSYSGNDL